MNIDKVKPSHGKLEAFDNIAENCTWHVVKGKADLFKSQTWWKDSWTIIDDLPVPSGINPIFMDINNNSVWYTLQGVRLSGKPGKQGVYLHQGRKVLVK